MRTQLVLLALAILTLTAPAWGATYDCWIEFTEEVPVEDITFVTAGRTDLDLANLPPELIVRRKLLNPEFIPSRDNAVVLKGGVQGEGPNGRVLRLYRTSFPVAQFALNTNCGPEECDAMLVGAAELEPSTFFLSRLLGRDQSVSIMKQKLIENMVSARVEPAKGTVTVSLVSTESAPSPISPERSREVRSTQSATVSLELASFAIKATFSAVNDRFRLEDTALLKCEKLP